MDKKKSTILLFVALPILIYSTFLVSAVTTTYDFNDFASGDFTGGEDFDVDSYPPDNTNPPDSLGVFSLTERNRMLTSDNQYASSSVPDDGEGYAIFNSTVGNGVISSLNWSWEGNFDDSDTDNTLHFFLWNNTGSAWYECATNLTDNPTDISKSCFINSGISDFYDSARRSYFMVWGTDPDDLNSFGSQIDHDYVALYVDSILVTLNSPSNNTYSKTALNFFSATGSDSSLQSLNLSVWNSTNSEVLTNSSAVTGSTNSSNLSLSITPDGVYKWNYRVFTVGGTSVWGENNFTITIDTLKPAVSILSPANNSNTTNTGLQINVSASDTNLASCKWSKNAGSTNTSLTCGNNITGQTWSEGLNTILFYANDSAGNENSTAVTFRLDTTAPVITLAHPLDSEEFSTNLSLPLNFSAIDAGVGVSSCWFSIDGGANTTITSCANTTFNTSDGAHNLKLYSNDTLNNVRTSSTSFTVSLGAPAITLNSPINGTYWNNGTNFYLNYTATDTNGIDFCEVWHDFNGTFALNQTNTGVTSGAENFTSFDLLDGTYLWNIFCEDTTAQGRFSTTNKSFIIDLTDPVVNLNTPSTTVGSQTINFTFTVTELHKDSCKYSIFNNLSAIDGLNNNVSITCDSSQTATVTAYGDYTLRVYSLDLADNEGYTDINFTTTATTPGGPGGGGGSSGGDQKTLIPVIGLLDINASSKTFNELQREVIYAKINSYCSTKINGQLLAIEDLSGECSVTVNDLAVIQQELGNLGFSFTPEEMIAFFKQYSAKNLFQGFEDIETIQKYGLFTSVLGIPNPMRIDPPSLRQPFFKFSSGDNITIQKVFLVNKNIKECSVIAGAPDLTCDILTNTTFRINYYINETDFFDKTFTGEISVTSDADPQNLEVRSVPLSLNVYNFSGNIAGIPAWVLIAGALLIIIIVGFVWIGNKKFKKQVFRRIKI